MRDININNIQIQDLELFLTAAKYGSFTKAGEMMFLSQSWVSKRISFMERELGLQLFVRNNRKLTLTPAGRILALRLEAVTDHILDALQEAHSAQKGAAGYLRLGFLDWNANPYMKVLERFMEQNPRILVDVLFQQFSELKKNFMEGRTDMIFTVSYDVEDLPDTEYHVEALERIPLIAYMNRKNHLADRAQIRVEDLRPESMLMLDPNSCRGYTKYINGLFSSHHVSPLVYQYANSGREHLGNILLNRGILLASRNFLADTYPEDVAAVEVSDAVLYLTATWKKENCNPAVRMFLEACKERE